MNPGLADAGEAETSDMPYSFEFRDEWSVSQRTAGGSSNYDTVRFARTWVWVFARLAPFCLVPGWPFRCRHS